MTHFLIKMSQLCIHTQPQVLFAQSSTKRKSIQRTSTCIWIKRKPWLKHHIHDEDHPKGTHHTRYHSSIGGSTYSSPPFHLDWNEFDDWTLVWINQIWWFHSSMSCRQVLWSADLSCLLLNAWDSQRDTNTIDFYEW